MRRRCTPCTASGEPQDKPQIVSRIGIWSRHAAHWSVLKMSAQAKTNLPHRKQKSLQAAAREPMCASPHLNSWVKGVAGVTGGPAADGMQKLL